MLKQKSKAIEKISLAGILRQILLSWLLGALVEYALLPRELQKLAELEGLGKMSLVRVTGLSFAFAILFFTLSRIRNTARYERWAMAAAVGILGSMALRTSFTWAFLGICALLFLWALIFAIWGWNQTQEGRVEPKNGHKACVWITVGFSLLFFLFVSAWTVGRIYSFSTPTYDFGIFSQMFHYMKSAGLPLTTVERDGLLSHFAVHVSPIYYLLLPFYCILPTPATLQVLQAAVMTSAVLPLWKIGKHHGLTAGQRMLLCALLLLSPAFIGGVGYDIHENCFLTPLILWVFYGIDRRNWTITIIAAFLTLLVKEDAAVYVGVIGLWLIAKAALHFQKSDKKPLIMGLLLLGLSVGCFFLTTGYLARLGDGVMTDRYKNFMYDGSSSLLTVIKALFLHPMKTAYECVDGEKLPYIAMTLLPLLGLPSLTRRYERYLLLIPYILVNLMSDYRYQHEIFYQYSFGSWAFLLYLTAVNLADMKGQWKKWTALCSAVLLTAVCFGIVIVPKAMSYPIRAIENYEQYEGIRQVLDLIPEGKSVTASTFYTTHLSQRDILYDIAHSSKEHLLETDYVVLALQERGSYQKYATGNKGNGLENLIKRLEERGYEEYASLEGLLVIYRRVE